MTLAATGFLALGTNTPDTATPGHLHCKRGRVQQVDALARMFSIGKPNGKPTGIFAWNECTRFLAAGRLVSGEELKPGERAVVRYQAQNGRQLAAEVVLHQLQPSPHA